MPGTSCHRNSGISAQISRFLISPGNYLEFPLTGREMQELFSVFCFVRRNTLLTQATFRLGCVSDSLPKFIPSGRRPRAAVSRMHGRPFFVAFKKSRAAWWRGRVPRLDNIWTICAPQASNRTGKHCQCNEKSTGCRQDDNVCYSEYPSFVGVSPARGGLECRPPCTFGVLWLLNRAAGEHNIRWRHPNAECCTMLKWLTKRMFSELLDGRGVTVLHSGVRP